jgi:hypothetical protein
MATDPPEYQPYFYAYDELLSKLAEVYVAIGEAIAARKYVYHRGAFYLDAALAIERLLALQFQPLMECNYNWQWWADEMRKHGEALGDDAPYAMILPGSFMGEWHDCPALTNRIDKMVSLMTGVYQQEEDDADVGGLGTITPAECVKLTHRFCRYWLWQFCSEDVRGYKVPWPWLKAVTDELQQIYRKMGEADRAGSSGTPGGPMPPVSWPGA